MNKEEIYNKIACYYGGGGFGLRYSSPIELAAYLEELEKRIEKLEETKILHTCIAGNSGKCIECGK